MEYTTQEPKDKAPKNKAPGNIAPKNKEPINTADRIISNIKGVSLVEVLVALFILSIGVLGIVGLQVLSLQNNAQALNRTQAVLLANGMIDRIKANSRAAYGINLTTPPALLAIGGSSGNCINESCDPQQISAFDMAIWKCNLGQFANNALCTTVGALGGGLLPQGDGSIQCATVAGITNCTVIVQWQERGQGNNANGTLEMVTINFQP